MHIWKLHNYTCFRRLLKAQLFDRDYGRAYWLTPGISRRRMYKLSFLAYLFTVPYVAELWHCGFTVLVAINLCHFAELRINSLLATMRSPCIQLACLVYTWQVGLAGWIFHLIIHLPPWHPVQLGLQHLGHRPLYLTTLPMSVSLTLTKTDDG